MLSQYRGYVAKQGIAGSEILQFGQKLDLEQKWIKESYPGLNSKPQEIAKLMASPDIEKARQEHTKFQIEPHSRFFTWRIHIADFRIRHHVGTH